MAEQDLVDVPGLDPGMLQRLGRDAHDQALDRFRIVLAEGRVGPADDGGGHRTFESGGHDGSPPGTRSSVAHCGFRRAPAQAQASARAPPPLLRWHARDAVHARACLR